MIPTARSCEGKNDARTLYLQHVREGKCHFKVHELSEPLEEVPKGE